MPTARDLVEDELGTLELPTIRPEALVIQGAGDSLWGPSSGKYQVTKITAKVMLKVGGSEYGYKKGHYSGNISAFGKCIYAGKKDRRDPETRTNANKFYWEQYTDSGIESQMQQALKKLYPGLLWVTWSEQGMQPDTGWNFDALFDMSRKNVGGYAKHTLSQPRGSVGEAKTQPNWLKVGLSIPRGKPASDAVMAGIKTSDGQPVFAKEGKEWYALGRGKNPTVTAAYKVCEGISGDSGQTITWQMVAMLTLACEADGVPASRKLTAKDIEVMTEEGTYTVVGGTEDSHEGVTRTDKLRNYELEYPNIWAAIQFFYE